VPGLVTGYLSLWYFTALNVAPRAKHLPWPHGGNAEGPLFQRRPSGHRV